MAQNFRINPSSPLELGWIPYFNLLPLRLEIERSLGNDVKWLKGQPTQVNRWINEGRVSLAPCSSVCLLKNSQLDIAMPLGVTSQGPVASVYLSFHLEDMASWELIRQRHHMLREIFRLVQNKWESDSRRCADQIFKLADELPTVPLEVIPPIQLTPASATSAALLRVFYRLWFGESAYSARLAPLMTPNQSASPFLADRRPCELLIGDEALAKRPLFRAVMDFGEMWRDLTDLPFVFAVWQANKRTMSPYWRQKLLEAAEIAQARMRVEPCHYLPERPFLDVQGRPVDLAAYWKLIYYRMTPMHFKGLSLFLALVRNLSPDQFDHQTIVNLTRWESMGTQTL
jgi:predicted solute-binding protein